MGSVTVLSGTDFILTNGKVVGVGGKSVPELPKGAPHTTQRLISRVQAALSQACLDFLADKHEWM